METRKAKTRVAAMVVLCACGILAYALIARGGGLEPIAPPGPTMHTLDEIYNLIGSQVQQPKAFNCFLYVEGIRGESTDAGHQDWSDFLAYSHGVLWNPTTHRAEHRDFTVVKLLDNASPTLSLYCCEGRYLQEVRIELCMASGKKSKFMEYKLTDVTVSAVNQFTAGATLTARPLEEVSFKYERIEWTYTMIDPATGNPTGSVQHFWDLATNTGG